MTALSLETIDHPALSAAPRAPNRPTPAAPRPHTARLGLLATIRALRSNPITAFPEEAYCAPFLKIGRLRDILLINDPNEIEHVLVGNAGNYRKSVQQQQRLRPALGDGLLTAEGEAWQGARKIAAPLFNPRHVAGLLDDMLEAAAVMRDRWLDRPGAAQTELRFGHASVPRAHPDFTTLVFLNTLLGGKFTSRINLNLRERHGYTYGASTRFSGRLGPGPFVASAAVATESTGAAAREVLSELRRIRDEPVTREEMEETRSYMLGVFPYTVQGMGDLARRLADIAVYGLPDDYYERYLHTIASLSRAAVQEAARRHLDPDRLAIVAVGPADRLRGQLEGLGEVVVRSADDLAGTTAGVAGPGLRPDSP